MRKEILGLKLWQLDSTSGGFEKVKEVFFFLIDLYWKSLWKEEDVGVLRPVGKQHYKGTSCLG